MINIKQNLSLKAYNTFGIDIQAHEFVEYNQPNDIKNLIDEKLMADNKDVLILGGGSNLLFTKAFDGLVIHPVNDNIEIIEETEDDVFLQVGAGKDWDEFVEFTVKKDLGGIENLSNIPGNVGAAPVQNIGAYGVEAKDTIHQVNLVSLIDGSTKQLSNKQCKFAYRQSIFKGEFKNKYLVDSVIFKLSKNPVYNINYGSLQSELSKEKEVNLSIIRSTIIRVRESKLPSPETIGNGGSFFKNPIIPEEQADKLLSQFPEMVTYKVSDLETKIAAAWLIDNVGLKGYINEKGTAGVHDKQALVLINKGQATGADIVELANFVKQSVFNKFAINLEPEVIFL